MFASGLDEPAGLAFDSAGDLFEADYGSNEIYKFTPGGTESPFAIVAQPTDLLFDSSGNLFVASWSSGDIYKFTPNGTQSVFASGLGAPAGMAFAPVPEPSALACSSLGFAALIGCRWPWRAKQPG